VEHPIIGRGMAAPVHRHTREDEYSFMFPVRGRAKPCADEHPLPSIAEAQQAP
jgi:hypothetical protein